MGSPFCGWQSFITGLSLGGGGERVAECIASLFPEAELFTLVADPQAIPAAFAGRKLHTSFLQWLPGSSRLHRQMMPLYPQATESLDVRGFDLVISSDSGPVKGVLLDPGATHICYCHSPMRYLWDGYDAYRAGMGLLTRTVFSATARRVRQWDVRAAGRVTHFIANSNYVAGRICRFYERKATVIHPPIDLHRAEAQGPARVGRHYLAVGRLVAYKQTELMVEACRRLGRELRVAGGGPEWARLQRMNTPGVTLLGEVSIERLWQEYGECRALLFAADEDFGMVALEAQACGRPVIAYGKGGSLETVRAPGPGAAEMQAGVATGVFFEEQTVDSLMDAILRFEALDEAGAFSEAGNRAWAEQFATPVFLRNLRDFVMEKMPEAEGAMIGVGEIERVAGAL